MLKKKKIAKLVGGFSPPHLKRGWQATRVQFFIDLWNWNITSYHKFSSSYKDMKFDYIF